MNPVKFKTWTCDVLERRYDNGRVALQLVDEEGLVATATVNMPNAPLAADEVLVKDWSENEGMLKALTDAGIVEPTGEKVRTGFAEAVKCRLVGRGR